MCSARSSSISAFSTNRESAAVSYQTSFARVIRSLGILSLFASVIPACSGTSSSPEQPSAASVPSANAATPGFPLVLYVAASGSDSNPGTQSAPFATIGKASTAAVPGTVVQVAAGTYDGGFKTTASGNASSRIRYVSETPWGARITPSPNSTSDTAWANEGNYVDIEGFEIDGANFQGGTKWRIGIYISGSNTVIRRNHIHHIATDPEVCINDGGAAVDTDHYYFGVDDDVLDNVIHHVGSPSCNAIHGVYAGTSGKIMNNLVYQIGAAAIHLWHDASNIAIANNTVFASTYGIIVGGGGFYHTMGPADYIHVSNNIVVDNIYGIIENGFTGTHNTYTNNLLNANSSVDWELQNGNIESGSITSPPQFVNYMRMGGGDYRLMSGSPAIDNGSPSIAPPEDIERTPRPQGRAVDIGAFEFVP